MFKNIRNVITRLDTAVFLLSSFIFYVLGFYCMLVCLLSFTFLYVFITCIAAFVRNKLMMMMIQTDWNPTYVFTSHHVPDMSPTIWLPWRRPLPSNGALNILQLWASGGRTREPILMKFGTQQQVRNTMTDTWSNIKIFKIQNGGRPPCSKILEMS